LIRPVGAEAEQVVPPAAAPEPKKEAIPMEPILQEEKPASPPVATEKTKRIKISPLARKMAEMHQMDISQIKGTGPEGAIVKADIEKRLAEIVPEKEVVEKPREVLQQAPVQQAAIPESEAIRKAVAAAMSRSNQDIPHYYLEKRMDMSKALAWLKEANKERSVQQRLLPVALFIKAVAKALDDVPDLNAVWENGLQRKNEINIGFVVSLRTGGIMVPAILNADTLSMDAVMACLNDIIPRARAFKLRSSELSQSTFTITSIGEGGGDKVFGVIYPPQVGIVGFGEIRDEAVVHEGMIGIKPVVDVTLAADHRATDGLIGGKFLAALNKYLQNPASL
jgi:pyruvate dehydrogenase E2 component (dihydrolipoamide acetyltransferase)